jgi:predicted nucleotidyltransferase
MPDTRYPTYEDIRARRIATRRAAALDALRRADAVAHQAGGRLVVFGSLAEGGFDERSDLDVAVFGLPPDRDGDVAAEVDTMLTLAGFEADVIPERFLSPSLRERVLSNGCDPGTLG